MEYGYQFDVQVYLDAIPPESVSVEIFADGLGGDDPVIQPLARQANHTGLSDYHRYCGELITHRPVQDFTPRIIPAHPDLNIALEVGCILWYR